MRLSAPLMLVIALCLLALGGHARAQEPEATPLPSLAEQVGFDDPALRYLDEQGGDHYFFDDQTWMAFGHPYRLLTVMGAPSPVATEGAALLYRLDDPTPTLVWKMDFDLQGMAPIVGKFDLYDHHAPPPGDWNGDGNIEFAVLAVSPCFGAADCSYFYVYQLMPDDTVVSPLAGSIPPGYIVTEIDAEADGSVLLELVNVSEGEARPRNSDCGPVDIRYFGWQDGKLQDVSAAHPEKYRTLIGCNVFELMTTDNPYLMETNMLTLLKTFDVLGERRSGWELVQNLYLQAQREGRLGEDDAAIIDAEFMSTMKQLYDAGQPFVVPDVTEPLPDFYAPPSNG